MRHTLWIKLLLFPILSIMLIIVSTNFLVNPYNVFKHTYEGSYNYFKSYALSDRMTKFYEANHIQPKTIMMGTSRIGFFNHTNLIPYTPQPIYNMAMAGASVHEQARYLEYMIGHHKLDTIVWGLDFFAFNPDKKAEASFKDERLKKFIYTNDYTDALLQYKTFERSIKTIKKNIKTDYSGQLVRPYFEEAQYLPHQGSLYNQHEIEQNVYRTLTEYRNSPVFLKSENFKNPNSLNNGLKEVQYIINLCKKHHIKCLFFISPVYREHLDMIYEIGLGDSFEYWKKSLAKIQPYYDFCDYNSVTNNIMNFRDSAHISSVYAPIIFGRVFQNSSVDVPDDFGKLISESNTTSLLFIRPIQNHPHTSSNMGQ